MKKSSSRTEAKEKIEKFFLQDELGQERVRKVKRLAMKHRIRLGKYRKRFCKKCYSDLKSGITRVTKTHKSVTCGDCGFVNKFKIS